MGHGDLQTSWEHLLWQLSLADGESRAKAVRAMDAFLSAAPASNRSAAPASSRRAAWLSLGRLPARHDRFVRAMRKASKILADDAKEKWEAKARRDS